jgi:hypothetical protein
MSHFDYIYIYIYIYMFYYVSKYNVCISRYVVKSIYILKKSRTTYNLKLNEQWNMHDISTTYHLAREHEKKVSFSWEFEPE